MTYNIISIDPRPASKDSMISLLEQNAPVIGIEFTLPALAQYLVSNIDDQHVHVQGASNRAACEVALAVDLPPEDTTLAIVRADTDALLAIAILNERLQGNPITDVMHVRIESIAKMDKFSNGEWPGQRPALLDDEQSMNEGLGAISFNFKIPVVERVDLIQQWLRTGNCPGLDVAQQEAIETRKKAATCSKISFLHDDPNSVVALVESVHIKATSVGYLSAPILIIRNPEFRFAGGEPHTKYTVCAWKAGYVDFDGLKKSINDIEAGWGGSATIIGSPQGVSSALSMEQVAILVEQHLL